MKREDNKIEQFTQEKFSALRGELKLLYVAITRTKNILVIVDDDNKVWLFLSKVSPMNI